MSRILRGFTAALLLSASAIASAQVVPVIAPAQSDGSVTMTVHGDRAGPVYDRRIFTQFAEHLGTGIYGGLWVGTN